MAKKPYRFQARYAPINGTNRHCFRHPAREAVKLELNTFDKSYRRPVCRKCVTEEK